MRILIAEDELYAREALIRVVRDYDPTVQIETAEDGDAAYAILCAKRYDLLLSDIRMPGLGGLALSRRAVNERLVDCVVLLTSFAEFKYVLEALRIGVRDYLLKPVDTEKLYAILDSLRAASAPKYGDALADTISTYILNNLDQKINISSYCRDTLFMHPVYVSRRYKQVTGETIMAAIQRLRMDRGFTLLRKSQLAIPEIARRCGYADASQFAQTFRKTFGLTPRECRDQVELGERYDQPT
ncbi:MAG: response regulator [Oscillospiraceae bacterium]|jgi:YesN/AraC family two-component response regulator|nr:response regulator [Oscillospiraceae bacterium]